MPSSRHICNIRITHGKTAGVAQAGTEGTKMLKVKNPSFKRQQKGDAKRLHVRCESRALRAVSLVAVAVVAATRQSGNWTRRNPICPYAGRKGSRTPLPAVPTRRIVSCVVPHVGRTCASSMARRPSYRRGERMVSARRTHHALSHHARNATSVLEKWKARVQQNKDATQHTSTSTCSPRTGYMHMHTYMY